MATLRDLYGSHEGRVSQKWDGYLDAYDSALSGRRHHRIALLEVGVQNGGSLEIWAEYFAAAEVLVGCDVDPACRALTFGDPRIEVVVGDISELSTVEDIRRRSPDFDVIIDDGSHRSADIIAAFLALLPMVRDGGVYIVEDLHCSYLEEFGGGLFAQRSALSFFRRLTDVINRAHAGIDRLDDFLSPILPAPPTAEFLASLSSIRSVEFLDSLCLVRIDRGGRSRLGVRVVAGQRADVDTGPLAEIGRPSPGHRISELQRSLDPVTHEDTIRRLSADLADLRADHVRLGEQLAAVTAQRDRIVGSRSWRLTAWLRRSFRFLFRRG